MLRITRYADRLLEDLAEVDWPESTLAMQRNWIGRSEGAEVTFQVCDAQGAASGDQLKVFTTRPDTLFGATYLVLAPEHALVAQVTTPAQAAAVAEYQNRTRGKSDLERTDLNKEKTGVFTGGLRHQSGQRRKDPDLDRGLRAGVVRHRRHHGGAGARRARPRVRGQAFNLPIKQVVRPAKGEAPAGQAFTDEGFAINSGPLDGHAARPRPSARSRSSSKHKGSGKTAISYRLRDWVFSRQRYWGEPIPIVHCAACGGPVPVAEKDLPVRLPDVERYTTSGTGESPLATMQDWVKTTCPRCGGPAERETNTMPQWAGSCWYYLRYLDAKNPEAAFSPLSEQQWMAVDLYVGGAEHAVLHLLYARFWHKVLFDLGYVTTKEPFKKLRHQGTVLAQTYTDDMGRYHEYSEVEFRGEEAHLRQSGEKLKVSIEKMAKSMLNGVNPDDVIHEHGADVLRLYEMFMGDFELPKPWDPRAIEGCNRFLRRLWRMVEELPEHEAAGKVPPGRSAPADPPQDHQAGQRRSRPHAVQHGGRGHDGVRERTVVQGRDPRGSDHLGEAGGTLCAAPG